MKAEIIPFPNKQDALTLWGRYVALVQEVSEDPSLADHPAHAEARLRAHQRFMQAFGGIDAKAG